MDWLERSIIEQHSFIENLLLGAMRQLSEICADNWTDIDKLNRLLKNYLSNKTDHRCRLLYAIDNEGMQHSGNITGTSIDEAVIGQDLSHRPYLKNLSLDDTGRLVLSDVYIDKQSHKPCITALHVITQKDKTIGFIAADFSVKDLPLKMVSDAKPYGWRQIKGDPSIRGTLFQQTRSYSVMDKHLGEVLDVIESLITDQGVFHAKLHFSSSRATLWHYNNPYHYRLHVLDEIINPKVCLAYEKTSYPEHAVTDIKMVRHILNTFKLLREADETIYLRAASLNIMNGLVGLNFSCDGSHYMPADEFLDKDIRFWFGHSSPAI